MLYIATRCVKCRLHPCRVTTGQRVRGKIRIAMAAVTAFLWLTIHVAAASGRTDSECLGFSADSLLTDPSIHLVFDATLTRAEPSTSSIFSASATVHRVWKGVLRQHTKVYFEPGIEQSYLRVGERYLMIASVMRNAPGQLLWPQVSDDVVSVPMCGALPHYAALNITKKLGRGASPQR